MTLESPICWQIWWQFSSTSYQFQCAPSGENFAVGLSVLCQQLSNLNCCGKGCLNAGMLRTQDTLWEACEQKHSSLLRRGERASLKVVATLVRIPLLLLFSS